MASLSSFVPRQLLSSTQGNKRVIMDFAERSGLVYFGYVSQRSDEHHIVRGMTVSTKHVDDHYCIGTHDTYDVVLVERSDTSRSGKRHQWHILEFDLKTDVDLPHVFIGPSKQSHGFHELLETKYHNMQPVGGNDHRAYPVEFTNHFDIYVIPGHAVWMEQLITPEIATGIGSHFNGLIIEITERALYVYSEKSQLTASLLDTMLTNGTWLAQHIDQNSRHR